MIVLLIILAALVGLAVWIVRVAGWRFALQRLGGALLILLLVTFLTSFLLRFVGVDAEQKDALLELGVSANAQPCVVRARHRRRRSRRWTPASTIAGSTRTCSQYVGWA